MSTLHNLGFPRIGVDRELKKITEAFWQQKATEKALRKTSQDLRERHWKLQADAGMDLIPVGDFSNYDQILDMSCLLGVIPERFKFNDDEVDLKTYFSLARGLNDNNKSIAACEMTKWFDTNYHYLVPEIHKDQKFKLSFNKLFDEIKEAHELGINAKAVIIGPLTWLWLAKIKGEEFDKLRLIAPLIEAYKEILVRIQELGVDWVQIDEPILCLDLPIIWKSTLEYVYRKLNTPNLNIMLATYFGELEDNLSLTCNLAVDAIHIDGVRGIDQIQQILDTLPGNKILSIGIIDGRNIWKTDLDKALEILKPVQDKLGDRLWIAPSCSLLHVPVDLSKEGKLDKELKNWLAFAVQKLDELAIIGTAINHGEGVVEDDLSASRQALASRNNSPRIHLPDVKSRVKLIENSMLSRNKIFKKRNEIQHQILKLPIFPTTTIGSFPQTQEIRSVRSEYKKGNISKADYIKQMEDEISHVVKEQEKLDLDVLVHGEAERNDMVEYFGELLSGFVFTQYAWVQSYGSRCVKPPIIYGDVCRPNPMTVDWTTFAQSCTDKPMKGMLTGPVTILNWSFVRDDQPRSTTAEQIALALRDEVNDLQNAGIKIIQIDEAALREGLPLRKKQWAEYLDWTVRAFRLTASVASDDTQIHTHMCYSEFNDIIEAIAEMDADVITIETSRSDMQLLDVFESFHYPNDIGPGVYDIHSPNVPTSSTIIELMNKAAERIPVERLWVNPDCGLKTRQWPEVKDALNCMVQSARQLREKYKAAVN